MNNSITPFTVIIVFITPGVTACIYNLDIIIRNLIYSVSKNSNEKFIMKKKAYLIFEKCNRS